MVITRDVVIPETVAVSWVWAIYFAYCIPEILNFVLSLYRSLFRSLETPNFSVIVMVVVMEIMHTLGMSVLLFVVLPGMDAVRGAMITNCLSFVPALLQVSTRNSIFPNPLKTSLHFMKVSFYSSSNPLNVKKQKKI